MSIVTYARVSTTEQAETDLSIPAQLTAMRDFAKSQLRKPIVEEFRDVASGTSLKGRPGLIAAMKFAVQQKGVDTLLVHRIDRLARDLADYHFVKGVLAQHHIQVVSVVEHIDDTPVGELIENIFASWAQYYSKNIGFEVRKSMRERLERGEWIAQPPIGYRLTKDKRLVPDPARAHFVKLAFHRYATEDISAKQLTAELVEAGFIGQRGKPIVLNRVYTMLRNPFYIGVLKTSVGEYPGNHEPLIDKELFDACQKKLGERMLGPRRKHFFPLAGKLKCPKCGRMLVGETHKKKSGRIYNYYRCHTPKCGYTIRKENAEAKTKVPDDVSAELDAYTRQAERQTNE